MKIQLRNVTTINFVLRIVYCKPYGSFPKKTPFAPSPKAAQGWGFWHTSNLNFFAPWAFNFYSKCRLNALGPISRSYK